MEEGFSLRMKGMVYRSCLRSAMLHAGLEISIRNR